MPAMHMDMAIHRTALIIFAVMPVDPVALPIAKRGVRNIAIIV